MSNPLFFGYADDAHLRAEQFAGTSAAYVLGRRNCEQDEWQRCKDRGSELYKYEAVLSCPNNPLCEIDEQVYMGNSASVPLWPYPTPGTRSNYPGTLLIDIRPGSAFVSYYVDHVASVIRSRRYTGLFLDGFGSQLFSSANWSNWPVAEREEWTASAVDLARKLDEMRRAEDPSFILIGNNHWDTAPQAEQYVDGIVSENHPATGPAWQRIVGKPTYSPLGHRRVFAITGTVSDAVAWGTVPGVTHVCCTADNIAAGVGKYSYPTMPVVGYSSLVGEQIASLQLQLENAKFDLALARGERDEAIQQRDTAISMYDAVALARDAALAECATRTAERDALVQACDVLDERLTAIAQICEAPR